MEEGFMPEWFVEAVIILVVGVVLLGGLVLLSLWAIKQLKDFRDWLSWRRFTRIPKGGT